MSPKSIRPADDHIVIHIILSSRVLRLRGGVVRGIDRGSDEVCEKDEVHHHVWEGEDVARSAIDFDEVVKRDTSAWIYIF